MILRQRGFVCTPIGEGYETRAIPTELKDNRDNLRNQQVYTASPVKQRDKDTDSEMYEISPYATFNVSGGRMPAGAQSSAKTPTRSINSVTMDYTLQFKTFGHPEGCELNATAYPMLPSGGFGHVKNKSSWHKQRYTDGELSLDPPGTTDFNVHLTLLDESTLSKSMTVVAGNSRMRAKRESDSQETRMISRSRESRSRNRDASESDTSISPTADFSNAPTYRVPVKASRGKLTAPPPPSFLY